jgi:hypothetical protein
VTVLQPPAPAGLPEWVKILITAGVGALFGITTNTAMEFSPKDYRASTTNHSFHLHTGNVLIILSAEGRTTCH